MANVAGESASKVSDQLTAVWNNFETGSKSLEYFADVMVKLGAYTASSTDEISAGMQKFAPIAQTVGLSYEYAASAITTLTAKTRESADTVGTSLKTIFSRIQGLNLGETLEDGTTLNKYSEALEKVGISIKDSSGELKQMDTILDEMGSKWKTLAEDEKMALAETVGGARQYTQLMALMNEWDYFKELVNVSKNSAGTLDEQNKIYEEGWEASTKRVRASLEGIWDNLINDKFFIGINDLLSDTLDIVNNLISAFGGMPGVLALVATGMTKAFGSDMAKTIDDQLVLLESRTPWGKQSIQNIRQEAMQSLITRSGAGTEDIGQQYAHQAYIAQAQAQDAAYQYAQNLEGAEKAQYEYLMDINTELRQQVILQGQAAKEAENQVETLQKSTRKALIESAYEEGTLSDSQISSLSDTYDIAMQRWQEIAKIEGQLETVRVELISSDEPDKIEKATVKIKELLSASNELQQYSDQVNISSGEDITKLLDKIRKEQLLTRNTGIKAQLSAALSGANFTDSDIAKILAVTESAMNNYTDSITRAGNAASACQTQTAGLVEILRKLSQQEHASIGEGVMALTNSMSSLVTVGFSVAGMFNTLNNTEMTFGEKTLSITSSLGVLVNRLSTLPQNLKTIKKSWTEVQEKFSKIPEYIGSGNQRIRDFNDKYGINLHERLTNVRDDSEWVWEKNTYSDDIKNQAKEKAVEQYHQSPEYQEAQKKLKELDQKKKNTSKSWETRYSNQQEQIRETIEQAEATAQERAELELEGIALVKATTRQIAYNMAKNALIAGISLAVVWIGSKIVEALHAEEKALEEANEALQQASKNYEKCAEACEDFKTAASNYDKVISSLSKLKSGTDEYTEALLKANEAAQELLKIYPNLQYTIGQDGLIQIDSNNIKKAQSDLLQQQTVASIAQTSQKIATHEITSDKDNTILRNKVLDDMHQDSGFSGPKLYSFEEDNNSGTTISEVLDEEILSFFENYSSEVSEALLTDQAQLSGWLNNKGYSGRTTEYSSETAAEIIKYLNGYDESEKEKGLLEQQIVKTQYQDAIDKFAKTNDIVTPEGKDYIAKKIGEAYQNQIDIKTEEAGKNKDLNNRYADYMTERGYTEVKRDDNGNIVFTDSNGVLTDAMSESFLNRYIAIKQVNKTFDFNSALQNSKDEIKKVDDNNFDNIIGNKNLGNSLWKSEREKQQQEIKNYYNRLSDEDKTLFAKIEFEDGQTLKQIQVALAKLQAEADADPIKIQTRIDNIKGAANDLTEDMSNADWEEWFSRYGEEFGIGNKDGMKMSQGSFQQLDYEAQQDYIEKEGARQAALAQNNYDSAVANMNNFWGAGGSVENMAASQGTIQDMEIISSLNEAYDKLEEANLEADSATADFLQKIINKWYELEEAATIASNQIDEAYQNSLPKDLDWESVERYADALQDMNKEMGRAAALETAKRYAETEKGLEDLKTAQEDYNTALKEDDQVKQAAALDDMAKAVSKITGVPYDRISKGFLKSAKGAKMLDKALKGSKKDVEALQQAAQKMDLAKTLGASAEQIEEAFENGTLDNLLNKFFEEMPEDLGEKFKNVFDTLQNVLPTLDFGDMITGDPEQQLANLAQSLLEHGRTIEEIQEMFLGMGVKMVPEGVVTLTATAQSSGVIDNYTTEDDGENKITTPLPNHVDSTNLQNTAEGQGWSFVKANGGSGGGGSGGGGGGGGGQPKTPKAHKKSDMGKRYHRTKERISDTERKKESASQKKERGYGKEKITQAETEIKLQKEKISLQKEYVEEAVKYLAEDRKTLEDFAASVKDITGMDLEFDNSGVITNFREMEAALLSYENHLIDLENAGMEGPWLELEQRRVDDMREYIDRYEETLNLYEEQLQELMNQADELDQLWLEFTDIKVTLKVDVAEDKLAYMEYMLGKIEDNAYKVADAMSYIGQQAQGSLDKIAAYREGIDEILRRRLEEEGEPDVERRIKAFYDGTLTEADLIGRGFTQDDIDQIREYRDGLIEAMEALNELRTTELDKLTESFDSFNEQLEGQTAILEHHISILEAYQDIVDLIGTHNMINRRELAKSLNQAQMSAVKTQLGQSKNVYDTLLAQREAYKSAMEEAIIMNDEDSIRMWRERLNDINDTVNSAQETYLSNLSDALDTATEIFQKYIEQAAEDYDKVLSPLYDTIDFLQDAYDRQETVDNDYVQDYEKIYSLQKAMRTLDEAIDDTDNIAAKNRLKKIQQEINGYKADEVKMSEYDLEALEKRIELEKARIALEEGEDSKSTVALTRDSEGNWGYVYTADEEAIREKEQEYEDKLKEYQDLNHEYIEDLQSQMLDFEAETRDAIKDIWEDTTLTETEKLQQVQRIYATAMEHMADMKQQLDNALENQANTYDLALNRYKTDSIDLLDTWEETRLAMLTGFKDTNEVLTTFGTGLEQYIVTLKKLQEDYENEIADIKKEGDISNWAGAIGDEIDRISEESQEAADNITQLGDDMSNAFQEGLKSAITFEETYRDTISSCVEENERFIASLTNMIAILSRINTTSPEYADLQKEYEAETAKLRDSGNTPEAIAAWDSWYAGWSERMNKWLRSFETTGSYTESTGTALTDSAGAVTATLDSSQTASIISALDMNTSAMSQGLGTVATVAQSVEATDRTLEQNVYIEADFPNANDSNEIRDAFEMLAMDAVQYTNKKDENF